MPERPEIATMANQLSQIFKDKKCNYVIITERYKDGYNNGLYSSTQLYYQLGQGFKYVAIGGKLTNITSRGKKIIFEFAENENDRFRFVSACGLDGRWTLKESKYTCIKIIFDDCIAFYEQVRIGGNFSICRFPSSEYNHIFSEVGPDLMTDETLWEKFYFIMRNSSTMHWKIAEYMMEQKFMSGIGNYLRADILYKSRIHPWRTLGSLSDNDLYNLWVNTKNTIFESYNLNGMSIRDYIDINSTKGSYQSICYGKNFDQFGNCIINEKDKKGRTIYYCPAIQI